MPNKHRLGYAREYWAKRKKLFPTHNMLHLAKCRAKQRNLEFDLSVENLIIPEVCPVLGIPLYFGGGRNNAPSLDRVDPKKGYTKGNICIISNKANQLKSNATLDELQKLVNYVKGHNENCA